MDFRSIWARRMDALNDLDYVVILWTVIVVLLVVWFMILFPLYPTA